jgi:hypothetical protein
VAFLFSLKDELSREASLLGILLTSVPDYALAHPALQNCNEFVVLRMLYAGFLFMFIIMFLF